MQPSNLQNHCNIILHLHWRKCIFKQIFVSVSKETFSSAAFQTLTLCKVTSLILYTSNIRSLRKRRSFCGGPKFNSSTTYVFLLIIGNIHMIQSHTAGVDCCCFIVAIVFVCRKHFYFVSIIGEFCEPSWTGENKHTSKVWEWRAGAR